MFVFGTRRGRYLDGEVFWGGNLIFENPEKFSSCAQYIEDCIEKNRSEVRTSRWFSRQLKWPPSLIADIISGRKKLSLRRALEFSERFNFGPTVTEKLIYLVFCESGDEPISRHFKKLREAPEYKIAVVESSDKATSGQNVAQADLWNELLRWGDSEKIIQKRPIHEGFFSDDFLAQRNAKDLDQPVSYKLADSSQWKSQLNYLLRNFLDSLEISEGEFRYSYTFRAIPESQLGHIDNKVNELIRWIHSLGEETTENGKSDVHQIVFCMNPVVLKR